MNERLPGPMSNDLGSEEVYRILDVGYQPARKIYEQTQALCTERGLGTLAETTFIHTIGELVSEGRVEKLGDGESLERVFYRRIFR